MAVWDDGACHPQTAVPLPLHVESPTGSNTSNTSQESEFASSTSSRSNSNSPTATPVRIHLYTTTTTTAATTDPRTMPPCDVSSGIRSSSALTSAMKPEVDDNHDLESHCTTTTHPTSLRDAQNSSANAEGNSSHHRPLLFPARTLFSRLAAVVVHTTTTTNTDNEEDCCKEETNSLEEDYYTNPYISFSEMECCTGPERGLDAYADIDNADDADVFHVTTKPNLQKTPSSLFLRSRRLSSSASSSSSRMMSRGNNCETGEERRSSSTTTPRVGRRRHGTESLFNNSNANKTPCTATTTTTSPPSTSSYTTTTTNCTNTTGTPSTFTTPTPATTSNLLRPKNNTGGHHPPSPPLLSVVKRMASTKYIPWLLCLVGLTSVSMIVTTHHKISTDMEQQQHQYHHDRPDNHRHKDPVSVLFHRHGRHSSSSLHSKRDSKARTTTSSSTSVEQSAHQLVPLLRHAGSHAARLPERDASLPSSKNNNISMDMINPEDRNHDDPLKNHQHQHHRTVNLNALAQFPETEIPEQPHPVFASRPGKTDLTIAARLQHHHHHHGHLEGNTVDEEEPHHQQQQQQNYHHIRRFRNRGKSSTTQTRVHEHDRHHGHLGTIESSSARVYKIASSQGLLGFQAILPVNLPPAVDDLDEEPSFEFTDRDFYSSTPEHGTSAGRRIVALHGLSNDNALPPSRLVQQYPAEITDNTQLYGILDSGDEHISTLEMRAPYVQGECVPMQEWQTTFNPSCNGMHELDMPGMGDDRNEDDFKLFGMNGFWRNAWRYDSTGEHGSVSERDTVVLKTLKINHRFEDAYFENHRIDAVVLERLTASPHVINVFGYCGHSVITEYADGKRLGELADKIKKVPLARLQIARDIANGLADVHGIDGDGNATFVHLDINPANVVSIGGTLKLNDFNIGVLRRWNTTSNSPCGIPAQYPNPQWRSPEEARHEQTLTEKVDVFSLGHIFFRLICGHEPWHKLEPDGMPSKGALNEKVKRGILPTIPAEVMHSTDPEVIAIRKAMLRCYTYDPAGRPSARDIAIFLENVLQTLKSSSSSSSTRTKIE